MTGPAARRVTTRYHYINPFASPHIVVGGGGFVVRVTSPNNVNVSGYLCFEE